MFCVTGDGAVATRVEEDGFDSARVVEGCLDTTPEGEDGFNTTRVGEAACDLMPVLKASFGGSILKPDRSTDKRHCCFHTEKRQTTPLWSLSDHIFLNPYLFHLLSWNFLLVYHFEVGIPVVVLDKALFAYPSFFMRLRTISCRSRCVTEALKCVSGYHYVIFTV